MSPTKGLLGRPNNVPQPRPALVRGRGGRQLAEQRAVWGGSRRAVSPSLSEGFREGGWRAPSPAPSTRHPARTLCLGGSLRGKSWEAQLLPLVLLGVGPEPLSPTPAAPAGLSGHPHPPAQLQSAECQPFYRALLPAPSPCHPMCLWLRAQLWEPRALVPRGSGPRASLHSVATSIQTCGPRPAPPKTDLRGLSRTHRASSSLGALTWGRLPGAGPDQERQVEPVCPEVTPDLGSGAKIRPPTRAALGGLPVWPPADSDVSV